MSFLGPHLVVFFDEARYRSSIVHLAFVLAFLLLMYVAALVLSMIHSPSSPPDPSLDQAMDESLSFWAAVLPRPLQHVKVPAPSGVFASPPVPLAAVRPRPLQHVKVPAPSGFCAGLTAPRAAVGPQPLQHLETSFEGSALAGFKLYTAHTCRSRQIAPCFSVASQPLHAFHLRQSPPARAVHPREREVFLHAQPGKHLRLENIGPEQPAELVVGSRRLSSERAVVRR